MQTRFYVNQDLFRISSFEINSASSSVFSILALWSLFHKDEWVEHAIVTVVWSWYAAQFSIIVCKNELKNKMHRLQKVKTRINARKDLKQKIQTAEDASRAPQPLTWGHLSLLEVSNDWDVSNM